MLIVPTTPRWLANARDELAHHLLQMKPASVIEEEVRLHSEYLRKYGEEVDHLEDSSQFKCVAVVLLANTHIASGCCCTC